MAVYVGQGDVEENVSTADKPIRRCQECDRETDDWVRFINPDNSEQIVCWICQQRADKNYFRKSSYHRVRRELATGATANKNEHGEVSAARSDNKTN